MDIDTLSTTTLKSAISNLSGDEILKFIGIPLIKHIEALGSILPSTLRRWIERNCRINGVPLSPEDAVFAYSRIVSIFIEREYAFEGPFPGSISGITPKGFALLPNIPQKPIPPKKLPSRPSIKKDARKKIGDKGEKTTFDLLRRNTLPGYYKLLHNVVIKEKSGKILCEIDSLIISTYGIYIVENKEIFGILKGKVNEELWIRINYHNKKNGSSGHTIGNPILQNRLHSRTLINKFQLKKTHIFSFVVVTDQTDVRFQGSLNKREYVVKRSCFIKTIRDVMKSSDIQLIKDEVDDIMNRMGG